MPLVDVTELLSDPDFVEDFTVIRSTRTMDQHGRVVDLPGQYSTYGSIQPTSGSTLMILPEAERVGAFITVVTMFPLIALSDTTAPDRIIWHNKTYQVKLLNDWTDYGQGFVSAVCELIHMTPDIGPSVVTR